MNGKEMVALIIVCVLGSLAFIFSKCTGKFDTTGEPAGPLDSLDREHGERERELEANLRELGSLSEGSIAALEGARAIAERTGIELRTAAGDLREAKRVLKDLAEQIEDLQSELDDCRTGLYRIRNLAGVEGGG